MFDESQSVEVPQFLAEAWHNLSEIEVRSRQTVSQGRGPARLPQATDPRIRPRVFRLVEGNRVPQRFAALDYGHVAIGGATRSVVGEATWIVDGVRNARGQQWHRPFDAANVK